MVAAGSVVSGSCGPHLRVQHWPFLPAAGKIGLLRLFRGGSAGRLARGCDQDRARPAEVRARPGRLPARTRSHFHVDGLVLVLSFSIGASVVAALASAMRGRHYAML